MQEDQELIHALLDRHGTGRVLFRNVRESVGGFPRRLVKTWPLADAHDEPPEDIANDPRAAWLLNQLAENPDKHLVICSDADTAIQLEQYISETTGIRSASFHEGMDLVSRDRAASYFADLEAGARVLVCSELGSEGRNFQFASQLVMFDLPVAPDLLEQRIGRLDRIGQHNDVTIHVPYIEGSPQHDLLRWYRDGLQMFHQPNPVAQAVFDVHVNRYDQDSLDDIIADCQKETEQRLALLADGRDQLLELNSHKPAVSAEIVAQLNNMQGDATPDGLNTTTLLAWLDEAFDLHGLESDLLRNHINLVKPTEMMADTGPVSVETMKRNTYPNLPEDGIAITTDRDTALASEEVQYITWEAPLVQQALDFVLADFMGNCSVIAVPVDDLQDLRMAKGTMLLESIHRVECLARRSLFADRFMPACLVRCLISPTLKDLADMMPYRPFASTLDIPTVALKKVVASQEEGIRLLLTRAQEMATDKLGPIKEESLAAMNQFHDREITRLTRLARVNPNVRQQEIDHLAEAKAELADALAATELRLEALRIIIAA